VSQTDRDNVTSGRRANPPRAMQLGLLALLLMAIPLTAAHSQISPGPLSTAHEELEGVTNCLKCHSVGKKKVEAKCLECHREVEFLRRHRSGLHARTGSGACGECHPEHGGRDFAIVEWGGGGEEAFDHTKAGWRLDGKHAETDCRKCHKTEFHAGEINRLRPGGLNSGSWMGLKAECVACHKDPHDNRFGTDCISCHTNDNWRTVRENSFDHTVTRYPLEGLHTQVECAKCHKDGYEILPQFAECRSCHQDTHSGEAKIAGTVMDCSACHTLAGFVPSTFDVARHAESKYPLIGRHQATTCRACHRPKEEPFRFRLKFAQCTDCHKDAHAGQLKARADAGQCSTCHNEHGFHETSFTVDDHSNLRFPLWGAHQKVACKDCHARPATRQEQTRLGVAGLPLHFKLKCHNASQFVPSLVDPAMHSSFKFRLEGAHGALPCLECHGELTQKRPGSTLTAAANRWPVLSFRVAEQDCYGCHDDPHAGQFNDRKDGGACVSCHTLDAFRPATRFDHDRDARFALSGAHARIACRECHKSARLSNGAETLLYRPIAFRCEDCHVLGTPGESQ